MAEGQQRKSRRTKGDGGLSKTSRGLWVGSVEIPTKDGKRRRKEVSSKDRNVALRKLKELRSMVDSGALIPTGRTTVAQWLDTWITEIHGPTVAPKTARGYADRINLDIVPAIGGVQLSQLEPSDVRAMYAVIAKKSDRCAQQSHIVLRRALADAIKEGILGRNATDAVAKPEYVAREQEPLTAEQAKQLLRSARENHDPMFQRWASSLLLGARPGEVLGLSLDRCDLDKGVVDFKWQLQYLPQVHGCGEKTEEGWPCGRERPGWCPDRRWDLPPGLPHTVLHRSLVLTPPKTETGRRVVPIPAPLWGELRTYIEAANGPNPHNLVWRTASGHPINPRADARAWHEALATAKLPPAPPYVSRHTTATLLLEAGVPEEVRMAIMGHSSAAAQRKYVHVNQDRAREALSNLDGLLG